MASPERKRTRRDGDPEERRGSRRSRDDEERDKQRLQSPESRSSPSRDSRSSRYGRRSPPRESRSSRDEKAAPTESRRDGRRSPPREFRSSRDEKPTPREFRSSLEDQRQHSPERRSRSSPPARGGLDDQEKAESNGKDFKVPRLPFTSARDEDKQESPSKQAEDLPASILRMQEAEAALEANEKAKQKKEANFEYSGALAAETNSVNGVPLVYSEPTEARKPTMRWRLYVFKGDEALEEPLLLHRQSCYLFGRERKVADIPTDHPSCSKQHAVIQYRLVEKVNPEDETTSRKIRPYLMDLGSTNGTFLNGERLEPQRYYELFEKDTIKFGNSSREYVLLHADST